ncbi:3-methyl-2-oxobutanoate dehydrogenase subunit VorB [Heliobacterium gestii]|uniref:3-methyl-2-oxobutanoate dehydrogenase subunit VorB n=1 Tax=Heliomicrobium gestii TaxID=2699 RepID=A0A845LAA5_HELGE|nr:3-methyl-2-oxobutanoate dehydrogenase subunit VorB [Heliomicrobium gestii]MBM7865197.1 2-oxoglutarate ferredoxin oxidoreductase subunit alpha [Heliomicrobium gestii]MZP41465.1 3-methyl-2-oxobutanoate dehydrogenase subunit VorB [Heliomicrobium gestii]
MAEKKLMKGNEALAEAAIRAGCRFFFGYPITPQNELLEYMARHLPEVGGTFLQSESEIGAINMVFGASCAGVRVMTSSSGPGISLKQEGISYLAGSELPAVIVNIMRTGPGLGGIAPTQSDYFQATKGGGHGDYRLLVLAPASVQEMADLTALAFEKADEYRNPVLILGDGVLGQMMEPVILPEQAAQERLEKPWATTGKGNNEKAKLITSLYIKPEEAECFNSRLRAKYSAMEERETRFERYRADDAEVIAIAYGTAARLCMAAVDMVRERGIRAGLIRPITLFPFPVEPLRAAAQAGSSFLTVELSTGQMVEDVRLAIEGRQPVEFYGRTGGMVPEPRVIADRLEELARKKASAQMARSDEGGAA